MFIIYFAFSQQCVIPVLHPEGGADARRGALLEPEVQGGPHRRAEFSRVKRKSISIISRM